MLYGFKIFVVFLSVLALIRAGPSRKAESVGGLSLSVADHQGRVQIKVFRGPTEHDGQEHFTPWGYWVKQPADDH